MRALILILLLAVIGARPALAADADPEARYQAMVTAAKADSQSVDWQALRFAYADRPGFNAYGDGQDLTRKQMRAAMAANDFVGALTQAQLICDQDYVDAEAHLIEALAYIKMGQAAAARRERDIGEGLLRSIQTGDGLTAKTAFTVINVPEEYSLVSEFGRRVTRQSLVRQDGHSYDVLETVDQKGDARAFYFLIDRVMAAEIKQFAPRR